jgi:hypothetical protein
MSRLEDHLVSTIKPLINKGDLDLVKELRSTIRILEIDNQALRDSRDMFQNRNAELLKTIGALKKKLQA